MVFICLEISARARVAEIVIDWDADARFAIPIPTSASSGAFLIASLTKSGKRLGTFRAFVVVVVVTVLVVTVLVVFPVLAQADRSITVANSTAMIQAVLFFTLIIIFS
jgi:hypothetical protein